MPKYHDVLVQQQLLQMDDAIKSFLDSYGKHRGTPTTQRTFIFFPGGMGSELVRAGQKYDKPLPTGGLGTYQTVWIDLEKVLLEQWALLLQMNADHDTDDRPMVAHGPLDNCALHPYVDLINWCGANQLDLLMVGYDFRRDADWCTGFFLEHLVPEVRKQAAARGWTEDVFANAVLVGHSLGGLVTKWILNEHDDPFCQNLKLAITVGTPFYGYTEMTEALFRGKRELGPFYDLNTLTTTIATLPGSYYLFLLDAETWSTYADQLGQDPEAPITDYPSLDATDGSQVDPYAFPANHPTNPNLARYPARDPNVWPWFASYLEHGLSDYQRVAQPLDPSIAGKLHNIRGIQTAKGADMADTKTKQAWGWYDISQRRTDKPQPVITTTGGTGDGVIPAWSARLVTQPAANIHTLRGEAVAPTPFEHMALMSHPSVQALLLDLIRPGAAHPLMAAAPRLSPATIEQFNALFDQVHTMVAAHTTAAPLSAAPMAAARTIAPAVEAIRSHLRNRPPSEQQALALRWLIQFAKGDPPSRR